MATATEPEAKQRETSSDDIVHLYCDCDPDLSLCGLDISDMTEAPEANDDLCVVCNDLLFVKCERCGE